MKKITILLILALCVSLASCGAKKAENETAGKENGGEPAATQQGTPNEIENNGTEADPEIPELPWADGPVETPMIPPTFIDGDELPDDEIQPDTPVEPATPESSDGITLDDKELPILQIVPEENETPAIPIN